MAACPEHWGDTAYTEGAQSKVEQLPAVLNELHEPFATMALLCAYLGLHISEAIALRWSDVDWLGSRLSIRRGIVEQVVDDVKTEGSAKTFTIAGELLDRLKSWKQLTKFSAPEDWIFASPFKIGRLPYSYTEVWRELECAAQAAGVGHLGTHAFRHNYRSWLDALGTPVAVRQKMVRHADIRIIFNIYGDVITDEMTAASARVAQLTFRVNGAQTERNEG
jgi:integrase